MHPSSACPEPDPRVSPCNTCKSNGNIFPCCAHWLWFCKAPPELPACGGPCDPAAGACTSGACSGLQLHPQRQATAGRREQEQPGPARWAGTLPHARQLWPEGGHSSCLQQYRFQRWLEHFGFCIWVMLTLQLHNGQLHFKRSRDCFSGTSIQRGNPFDTAKRRRRNKANALGKVQGFDKFNHLGFSGFSCYLNRKLHCFRQSAHLQFFSLLSLCCWEPHNVLPRQLLKCF